MLVNTKSKHTVLTILMLIYISLSACSGEDVTKTESVNNKKPDFVTQDVFLLTKQQTIALEKSIAQINQEIKQLTHRTNRSDQDMSAINIKLQELINRDTASIANINSMTARIASIESLINTLEKKLQSRKVTRSLKRKKPLSRFDYRLVDVSQWGDRVLVSIKVNHDYIFLSQGDVIGVWRLESADIQTRQVVFKHSKTQKKLTRVVL